MNALSMKEAEIRYEMFFEMSPDLMCIAGYDGYFKKVNPAVARTLGYSFEELYSRPINEFVHPDDQDLTSRVRNELTRSKPLLEFENRYLTKGGEAVWLSWTSLPAEEEEVIFAVAKNVTYKKRLEADRNALLANLTRVNKDLLQLNYATSDDLKSPVHSLLALFELIDMSKVSDGETIQLLEVLQYVGEKMKKSLNSHIDLLRNKTKQELRLEETDLRECLDQVLQSLVTIVHTSKATIVADFSKAPVIRANRAYVKSIFLNLITNAIRYARADRLPVISITSDNKHNKKQLIISDNGPGFDPQKMQRALSSFPERFQQDPDSLGIGLYLIHSHVAEMGGSVRMESPPGEGTTITITL